jgi:hypothetical protein
MYPSGRWDGFWVQSHYGRQPMTEFVLRFGDGAISGEGRDVIGPFTFHGSYDPRTGAVEMVKQYLGRHRVLYVGQPDGEGSILGTWRIGHHQSGSFLLRPVLSKPSGEEPIQEIG